MLTVKLLLLQSSQSGIAKSKAYRQGGNSRFAVSCSKCWIAHPFYLTEISSWAVQLGPKLFTLQ